MRWCVLAIVAFAWGFGPFPARLAADEPSVKELRTLVLDLRYRLLEGGARQGVLEEEKQALRAPGNHRNKDAPPSDRTEPLLRTVAKLLHDTHEERRKALKELDKKVQDEKRKAVEAWRQARSAE